MAFIHRRANAAAARGLARAALVTTTLASAAWAQDEGRDLPPEVRLEVPADSASGVGMYTFPVEGRSVLLRVEPADDVQVVRVELLVDGSVFEIDAKSTGRGVKRRITGKGESEIDGAPDASASFSFLLEPSRLTGTFTFVRPADGVEIRKARIEAIGPSPADRVLAPTIRFTAGADGEAWIDTPEGTVGPIPFTGTSKPGAAADKVKLKGANGDGSIKVKGTWDGTTFDGTASGSAGVYTFGSRRFRSDVASYPLQRVTMGSAAADLSLLHGGEVDGDVTLAAPGGAELFIADGTRIVLREGETVSGPVRVSFGDLADDAPPIPGVLVPAAAGEVVVEIGGRRRPGARFEPPALFRADFLGGAPAGRAWDFAADVRGRRGRLAPPAAKPSDDPVDDDLGYRPPGGWKTPNERLEWEVQLAERIAVYQRQVGAAGDVPGDEVTELEIPGNDTDEYPRVKDYIVVQDTVDSGYAPVLAVVTAPPGGMGQTVGEGVADVHGNYALSVVGRGGKRYVQCRTRFRNRLKIRINYCVDGPGDGTVESPPDPTPPVEEPDEGPFDGAIALFIDGWGGFEEWEEFDGLFGNLLPADVSTRMTSLDADLGGRYEALYQIVGYGGSVGSLADLLPEGFTVTGQEGRLIAVRQECPPPLFLSLGTDNLTVHTFTLSPLAETGSIPMPGTSFGLVVSPGGRDAWVRGGTDTLVRMDPVRRRIVRRRTISGLTGSVGLDPLGRFLYVSTNTGSFHALDPHSLETLWTLDGLPSAGHTHVSTPLDGGRAFLAVPSQSQIHRVDLVRRALDAPFNRAVQTVEASHDGRKLALSDLNGGLVVVVEADTGDVLGSAATGQFPIHVRWAGDDSFVATANQGSGSLSIVDAGTWAVTQFAGMAGAEGVETFRDGSGVETVLTGSHDDGTVRVLRRNGSPFTSEAISVGHLPSFFAFPGL